tara:strand:- start:1000 stop:1143 length:144 start_codon:yes stop_codon:yes gene_type:complete
MVYTMNGLIMDRRKLKGILRMVNYKVYILGGMAMHKKSWRVIIIMES